ncbi:MAG: hypothetical protein NTW26_11290 [bacterium]|nr:hypothetical protein [bacterium]
MAKFLDNLRWQRMWVSHLGALKGCLDYLGLNVSEPWLFGATGHAFILNIHETVCPSGPTAWNTHPLRELGKNLGYTAEGVFALKGDSDFAEKQKSAWEMVRRALDESRPCYGWELEIPEFYVIHGYDEAGYHYSGPRRETGRGPKPWASLGSTPIGCVEVYALKKGDPADDLTTVRDALAFVLEHARNPEKWVYPGYRAGLAGYDAWIKAVADNTAEGFGMAYNSVAWYTCRSNGVKFLEEAKGRIGGDTGPLFDEAARHYRTAAENLRIVADTFPFFALKPAYIEYEDRRKTAIEALTRAREAEAAGLGALGELLARLKASGGDRG